MVWQSKLIIFLPALLWCAAGGKCAVCFGVTGINDDTIQSRWHWSCSASVSKRFLWRDPRAVGHSVLRNDVYDQYSDYLYVPLFWWIWKSASELPPSTSSVGLSYLVYRPEVRAAARPPEFTTTENSTYHYRCWRDL